MSIAGQVHLYAAIVALVAGTLVLFAPKGSRNHKRIGYIYCVSMIIMLATAFMIYTLFGRWDVFHWAAVISSVTLAAGMIPMIIRRPASSYISLHFGFMYWSVMGLYAAFFAETMVRIPEVIFLDGAPSPLFYQIVTACLILTMIIGSVVFIRKNKEWDRQFRGAEL